MQYCNNTTFQGHSCLQVYYNTYSLNKNEGHDHTCQHTHTHTHTLTSNTVYLDRGVEKLCPLAPPSWSAASSWTDQGCKYLQGSRHIQQLALSSSVISSWWTSLILVVYDYVKIWRDKVVNSLGVVWLICPGGPAKLRRRSLKLTSFSRWSWLKNKYISSKHTH